MNAILVGIADRRYGGTGDDEIGGGNGNDTALGGEGAGRMVVLQFADVAAAKRWYNSPGYQAIVGSRQANSTGRPTLVEGV